MLLNTVCSLRKVGVEYAFRVLWKKNNIINNNNAAADRINLWNEREVQAKKQIERTGERKKKASEEETSAQRG